MGLRLRTLVWQRRRVPLDGAGLEAGCGSTGVEEQGDGVLRGIGRELVEHRLEVRFRVWDALGQRVDGAHQHLARFRAGIGLRPEAHLAGDHGGT